MQNWDYQWWDSFEEDWTSPDKNSDNAKFVYWWDDMRPDEVQRLVKEAYSSGYERGREELQSEVDRLREGIECHVARPGEGTYECRIDKECPACRLRSAEQKN